MPQFFQGFRLLDHLLLQLPGSFDFSHHFGRIAGLLKCRLDEVPHQGFKVAEAKHFNDASAKVRMKKAVLPKGVKSPIVGFEFFRTGNVNDVAVRAGFEHWFSCVSSSWKDVKSRFRGWTVHWVSANFVCKHNFGLKNFAPLKIFQKKKKKKRKCSDRVEGKCDAIFFQKNFGAKF